MGKRDVDLLNNYLSKAETVLTDYIKTDSLTISPHIAHLRNEEVKKKRMSNLQARRAVEDVFEMQRYRAMHKDYYGK